jgi:glucosyl-dolichyl phosphate glucuronosyltransferase
LPQNEIDITVCVCTRNRASELSVLLQSLCELDVPTGLVWEVLIVDNGSTDATQETVKRYADRLPIRRVVESRAGVAYARNRVLDEARGAYTCWVDDDVEVAQDWLTAYISSFERHPEAAVFGGVVEPVLEPPTPAWFAKLAPLWPLSTLVARRDLGDAEFQLTFENDRMPWGANMALKTAAQKTVRFDTNLGPSPHFRRTGEETEMLFDLMKTGVTGWWVPASRVRHHIVAQRQNRKYFFRYYYAVGETMAYLDSVKQVHYMNRDGNTASLVRGRHVTLFLMSAVEYIPFLGFSLMGLTRRGLYHLRKSAIYYGGAKFKAQASRQ